LASMSMIFESTAIHLLFVETSDVLLITK
jgi:hypothetical protein